MSVFLGVDGGGTKTDFLLIDESGAHIASHRAGSAYYPDIGLESLQAMLEDGIRRLLALAQLQPGDLAFACLGLPAYGEDSALAPRLDGIVAGVLSTSITRCVNDMVCGWAGALGGRDGINIVAGTGSIAYGEFQGRGARAGGWGELFSDEGSAHWIAREALTLFSRMSDGRTERGPLHDLVRRHFSLEEDLDLCAAVYGPPGLSRSALAALAPIAFDAAAAGDAQAQRLVQRAGSELAAIVDAVRDRLAVPAGTSLAVSYSGGLFRRSNALARWVQSALLERTHRYEFSAPRFAPSVGAALYAARLAGMTLTAPALDRLGLTSGAGPEDEDG